MSRYSQGGPTMSVEELIRIQFDNFYTTLKLNNIILPIELRDALDNLESNSVVSAKTQYSTEASELCEEAFQEGEDYGYHEGTNEGHQKGYDEGYTDGHDEGYTDGHQIGYDEGCIEGYRKGVEECSQ